ncbi:hypothetical protein ACLOJK_000624 [Asimina triloba]
MEKSYKLNLLFLLFIFNCHGMGENTTEMETLLAFKHQFITSDPTNALGGWNSSSPLCNWPRITYTGGQAHVGAIQLFDLGLSGTIPPLQSNLSSLILLDLSNNSFHDFLLTNNQLHGSLPPSLGLLTNLQALDVSSNSLAQEIPPSIGNLTSLNHLYLRSNQFSGDIPQELGGLGNLIGLQIAENQLTGMIPSSIYNISSIQIFSVTSNKLVGQLPEDMGLRFPKLTQLYMGSNQLSGTIPSSLSNISGMQFLNLPENDFQGSLPLLGNMPALLKLNLIKNKLSSSTRINKLFFDSLTNCTLLEELSVSNNQLAGSLPDSTANLSAQLLEFNKDDNLFSGSFPLGMHNYRNLTIQLVPIVSANPKAAYRFRRRLHSLPSAIDRPRYTLPLFSFAPALVRPDLTTPGPSVGSVWIQPSVARSRLRLHLRLRRLHLERISSSFISGPSSPSASAASCIQQQRSTRSSARLRCASSIARSSVARSATASPDLQRLFARSATPIRRRPAPLVLTQSLPARSATLFSSSVRHRSSVLVQDNRQPTATRRPTAHRTIAAVEVRPPLVVAASRRCRPQLPPIGGASS